MKIIAECGNHKYYETEAIILIKTLSIGNYDDNIIKAIQLLVLARESRYEENKRKA